jgi:rod shape-determining protein MreC
MLNRPRYIVLILVVLLVIGLLELPAQSVARLKMAIASLYLPLFGLSISAHSAADRAGNAVVPRGELVKENERLREENQQLRARIVQYDEVARENGQLRQLVGWRKQVPWKLKLGRVIGRDAANWWKSARIDLGSRDGIQRDYPVMTVDGLVGRVSSVAETWSQIIILGDPDLRVSAVVQESRETGIILAGRSSSAMNNFVDLAYLSSNSAVKPGQLVYTSGDGGIFPRGILIGRVVEAYTVHDELATEARVQIAAHMDTVEEVWVVLP